MTNKKRRHPAVAGAVDGAVDFTKLASITVGVLAIVWIVAVAAATLMRVGQ